MAVPDATTLLPLAHLALMNGAPARVGVCAVVAVCAIRAIALVIAILHICGRCTHRRLRGAVHIGQAAVLEQVGDSTGRFLKQLLASIEAQGDLALETVRIQVASVPGSRLFTEELLTDLGAIGVRWRPLK